MSKISLGNESLVGSLTPSNKKSYKVTNRIQEAKKPLYAVVFNFIDARFFRVIVTAGGNRLNDFVVRVIRSHQQLVGSDTMRKLTGSILKINRQLVESIRKLIHLIRSRPLFNAITLYNCLEDGAISALQSYADEDKEESFYTVSWACGVNGNPFVAAGGVKGIIRVIDVNNETIHKSLVGHGDSVNEIRTQPMKPQLVITASKDESVRLWNVETGICILIFAGAGGHRYEVLSVDFHPSDIYRFASCGMDTTIKIWSMKEFWTYVEKSSTWTDDPSKFPTKFVQFPVFTASVHTNYVDCNRWFGDFILSKSVDNEILLWEPQLKENSPGEGTSDVLLRYPIPMCDIWFIKFSCDLQFNSIAIGNQEGKIYVWDLKSCPPVLITKLSHTQSKSVIRQTAMSVDGSTILASCEDGTIWRWDVVTK